MIDEARLRETINNSGFPLQLRIEREIEAAGRRHRWEIVTSEHPWEDAESGKSGFIDLVIGHQNVRMVIECKRFQERTWVFIVPEGTSSRTDETARLIVRVNPRRTVAVGDELANEQIQRGWRDFHPQPMEYVTYYIDGVWKLQLARELAEVFEIDISSIR